MVIPNQHKNCIWCLRPLVTYTPETWQTGVERSEEHVIPESIGGRVKTYDLCKSCNSEFGAVCDHALVNDHRIIESATKAGVKLTDLRARFTGLQKTDAGTEVKVHFTAGTFKPAPQLNPKAPLMVPRGDWPRLRPQVRGSLLQRVLRKKLPLTKQQIENEVDLLLALVDAEPTKQHWSPVIREGFRQSISSGDVRVMEEYFPWETEWCLAKIIFELSCIAWPKEYRSYYRELVIRRFRGFLSKQEHDPTTKRGVGILSFAELDAKAVRQHTMTFLLTPVKLECALNFFGTAQWTWEESVRPITSPPGKGWRVTLSNPTSGPDATLSCDPL